MIPFQVAVYSLSSLLMDSHWIYQTIHTFAFCIAPPRSVGNKMGQNTRNKNVFHVQLHRPDQELHLQRVWRRLAEWLGYQASPAEPTSFFRRKSLGSPILWGQNFQAETISQTLLESSNNQSKLHVVLLSCSCLSSVLFPTWMKRAFFFWFWLDAFSYFFHFDRKIFQIAPKKFFSVKPTLWHTLQHAVLGSGGWVKSLAHYSRYDLALSKVS